MLDYILSKKEPTQHVPGYIFVNPHNDVCVHKTIDGPCVSVLVKHDPSPLQLNIPLTGKELELVSSRKDIDGILGDEVAISTVSNTVLGDKEAINTISCLPSQDTLLSDIRNQGVSTTF